MSFREKSAWISLITYAVVFGGYFFVLWQSWDPSYARGLTLGLTIGAVVMLIIIATGLAIVAAFFNPRDANARPDEREVLIDLKAERIASYTLAVGVVGMVGALLMEWNGVLVAVLLLATLVIAELVKATAQIIYFRAGV